MSYLTSYLKEKYTDYVTLLVTPNTVDRLAGGKTRPVSLWAHCASSSHGTIYLQPLTGLH